LIYPPQFLKNWGGLSFALEKYPENGFANE